ncbi:hypothetical protein I3842_11G070300 [Carya illinoinensis]|uniref:Uncharacterized protein n=1 Tax=Carya illinoinensis TaxID=32201 RepID=A0A922DN12_CARIL|nr:hypothetical protein I3842_11G070300 [Carya illinoinensis]
MPRTSQPPRCLPTSLRLGRPTSSLMNYFSHTVGFIFVVMGPYHG